MFPVRTLGNTLPHRHVDGKTFVLLHNHSDFDPSLKANIEYAQRMCVPDLKNAGIFFPYIYLR